MAYKLKFRASVVWVPDGAGAMSVNDAQTLTVTTDFGGSGGAVLVPGGNAPSTANIVTACNTAATNMAAAFNANIGQIQGFASGGG
ncbi:hypothetical protein [Acidocella sp.]|jgi:hypothetical protein|uniref:hypothetical protein n=1 Tax=Acidocella sp. TaxID=50710 RepID=UPI002F3EF4EE